MRKLYCCFTHCIANSKKIVAIVITSLVNFLIVSAAQAQVSSLIISEVAPWSSSNSPFTADWFELTNNGTSTISITGWKMDDNSNSFGSAVVLNGITSIAPGESVIFVESASPATTIPSFIATWFGANPPFGIQVGSYTGAGIGLSSSGDAVNIFTAAGELKANVSFGASPTGPLFATFDNSAGINNAAISQLSVTGVNNAFIAANDINEIGSPCSRSVLGTGVNLSNYIRIGRYDLPEPTRTAAPPSSLLAQEVSAVTYNWDTKTLFVVGDGGTSIVQVSKTGQLINSMTLAPGASPQGTEFYDPEGLSYFGNGKFVMSEERDRQIVLFTYAPGTTLTRSAAQTVKLGTFVQNIGIEGLSFDPLTNGYICVKEIDPAGIFQTTIDFNASTASNGSPTTENSINLFNPALLGLLDFADVYALSNLPALSANPQYNNLLVLSHESGKIVNTDRFGNIVNSLTIVSDPGNPLSVAAQQHEGVTMDRDGYLYVVSENGGGDFDHPQLWVYAPSSIPNTAPTAITLTNAVDSVLENTSTLSPLKVADIVVTDDGLGNNTLYLTGADSAFFQITGTALYIKAGTILDYETKTSYAVTVNVNDTSVGNTPDASVNFTLFVKNIINENPPVQGLIVSEVAPWSSGNSPLVAGDWFEITNTSNNPINISGWKMDDNSATFGSAVALNGITSIAAGESVIFLESSATNIPDSVIARFKLNWFGANPPANLKIGTYQGAGVGLSTGGDAVNIYDNTGVVQASVSFGASPSGPVFASFNNAAGLNSTSISQLSVVGQNGAFVAVNNANEIGSPGTVGKLFISEVAPWASGNSAVGADWFEVTNTRGTAVDITGWKMDDNSGSPVAALPISGITSIAPGESVIFIESSATNPADSVIARFKSVWFGNNPPAGLRIGTYQGTGVGLSTGGDAVNLYNSAGLLQASVIFGTSPAGPFPTFDNAAALNNTTISQLSVAGINGAFAAANNANEIGSPGKIAGMAANAAPVVNINSPVNNTALPAGSTVTVTASATDADGTVTKVEFYYNGIKFFTDSTAPYTFIATNVEAGTYILTAKAFDNSGDSAVSPAVTVTLTACTGSGSITGEGYTNVTGSQVADLTANPNYPSNPSVTVPLSSFEYSTVGDNYGARLRGYICAPQTGNYTFYIAGDDQAGLWLSTDENPVNKVLIAYNEAPVDFRAWTTFATQKSAPIALIKGVRYYIETLHKQSVGPNHLSVGWVLPDGTAEGPIPGNRLSPIGSSFPNIGNGTQSFGEAMQQAINNAALKVTVAPNPSSTYFTLIIQSSSTKALNVIITDASGRVVETKLNIAANRTIQIGNKLTAGVYFVEVMQDGKKQRVKLVKQ
jgi:uncharacterized protein YjiK